VIGFQIGPAQLISSGYPRTSRTVLRCFRANCAGPNQTTAMCADWKPVLRLQQKRVAHLFLLSARTRARFFCFQRETEMHSNLDKLHICSRVMRSGEKHSGSHHHAASPSRSLIKSLSTRGSRANPTPFPSHSSPATPRPPRFAPDKNQEIKLHMSGFLTSVSAAERGESGGGNPGQQTGGERRLLQEEEQEEIAFGPSPAYSLSKAAANAAVRAWAPRLLVPPPNPGAGRPSCGTSRGAARGVRLVAVCPGDVLTRMTSEVSIAGRAQQRVRCTHIRRSGSVVSRPPSHCDCCQLHVGFLPCRVFALQRTTRLPCVNHFLL